MPKALLFKEYFYAYFGKRIDLVTPLSYGSAQAFIMKKEVHDRTKNIIRIRNAGTRRNRCRDGKR